MRYIYIYIILLLGRASGVVKSKTKKRRTTKKRKTTKRKSTTSKTSSTTKKKTPKRRRKTRRRKTCGGRTPRNGVSYRERRQDMAVMESVRQALGLPEPDQHWSQQAGYSI